MPNRLARETSPYLLQHANNPVDWYPWGPEALQRSKDLQRPIFLSIGYSACHWCHVMEHESFEDEAIATALSEKFVCIKVDREERPDLDQVYMAAVQMMTGRGGWPMSVFLTPDLKPFYGGTYWPPNDRQGMPGFLRVVGAVADAWENRREAALQQAEEITEHIRGAELLPGEAVEIREPLLRNAVVRLEQAFDFTHGGFGRAPKFPHPMDITVLLRYWKRDPQPQVLKMVQLTLDKMAHGGIYDHLAGGFARYSVDERWLVPHFEKMLYDNALLVGAYLDGYQATDEASYARVVRETCDYILKYMTDETGGFHSTEDADSEGEEGKFYVWTPEEILVALGPDRGLRFCKIYDVTHHGNFEGANILNLPKSIADWATLLNVDVATLESELAQDRATLLELRDQRIRPGKDDKILTSWNALMIDALARAGGVLDEPRYLQAAQQAASFLLGTLRRADGRLLHSFRSGEAKLDAYLDDYAYLINAFVSLYQADFDAQWIDHAVQLADIVMQRFHDREGGGFFYTADDHEALIARNKDVQDSSVPSASGMTATALLRLGTLCGRSDYLDAARTTLELATGLMEKAPTAAGQMLIAADMVIGPLMEVVLVPGSDDAASREILRALRKPFEPNRVLALRSDSSSTPAALAPLFADRHAIDGQITMYVCQNFTCQAPVVGREAILATFVNQM